MTDAVSVCLWGCAVFFAALSGFLHRARPVCALLSAVCVVVGILFGLARGLTLERLLSPMLAACAVAMVALLFGNEGGQKR